MVEVIEVCNNSVVLYQRVVLDGIKLLSTREDLFYTNVFDHGSPSGGDLCYIHIIIS